MFLGTRESAFVHALSAAGVAHAVTRACTLGELTTCGCDNSKRRPKPQPLEPSPDALTRPSPDFEWSGCSENARFGIAFSEQFVDARERLKGKHMERGLINLHNNNAGRKVTKFPPPFVFSLFPRECGAFYARMRPVRSEYAATRKCRRQTVARKSITSIS